MQIKKIKTIIAGINKIENRKKKLEIGIRKKSRNQKLVLCKDKRNCKHLARLPPLQKKEDTNY